MCCSVNVSVCFVCCVLDSVCELFGETIGNVIASGDPQSLVLCILHFSVVGVVYVWTPNRCSVVNDRSSDRHVNH